LGIFLRPDEFEQAVDAKKRVGNDGVVPVVKEAGAVVYDQVMVAEVLLDNGGRDGEIGKTNSTRGLRCNHSNARAQNRLSHRRSKKIYSLAERTSGIAEIDYLLRFRETTK